MKYVNYDNLETAKEMIKVALDKKVDKEDGKGLSTNDYTNEDKLKLSGIEEEANKTIVDSELSLESTNPVQNKIVSEELNTKANKVEVEEALDTKADKTTVETELNTKADKQEVEEALETKANKSDVETALNTKADKSSVEELLSTKVDKESGKGLSTNDYTNEEKEKLSKLDEKSNENIIEVVKQNGQVLEIIDKSVNITVPTDTSELTNNAGFQTSTDVTDKIAEAMKDINVDVDLTNYVTNDELNQKGYLTSFTEEDPTVPAHVKAITEADITKWNSGTGSDNGSCNVIVSPTEPTTGEPVWIQTCTNLVPILDKELTMVRRAEPTVPVDPNNYGWKSTVNSEDNSVNVNGTPSHYLYIILFKDKLFKKGTYTLSYTSENHLANYGVNTDYNRIFFGDSLGWEVNNGNGITGNGTITLEKDTYMSLYIFNTASASHSWTYWIQIENGDKATPYTLPGGKNAIYINDGSGAYKEFDTSEDTEQYTLPAATKDTLGGIKVGENLTIDEDGTLNAQAGGSGGSVIVDGEPNELINVKLSEDIFNYEMTQAWTLYQIPLDEIVSIMGDGFSLTPNGTIKIGKGISKISIKASFLVRGKTNKGTTDFRVGLIRNGERTWVTVCYGYMGTTDNYITINNITPLFDVQENDEITLFFTSDTTNTFDISRLGTYLSVQKIHDTNVIGSGSSSEVYSTEETVIGKWIDGKNIYRKVIQIQPTFFGSGTPTEGATYQITHGINDLDMSTRCDVYWKTNEGQQRKFPSIYFKDAKWGGQAFLTIGLIIFELGSSLLNAIRKADYIYVILEYTKTTD